jgi:hypothetical protein
MRDNETRLAKLWNLMILFPSKENSYLKLRTAKIVYKDNIRGW